MKILFLTRKAWPNIGGVEKHIYKISKIFGERGHKLEIISEGKIKYPNKKIIGILYIWFWLFKHRNKIIRADLVHIHDVFIWYLPFRFMFPNKKVFTTIHGLEWDKPLSKFSIWQKRIAIKFSRRSVGVGTFLEKYIGRKFDFITYGAADKNVDVGKKNATKIVYVGRLEKNTGLSHFLKWVSNNPRFRIDFCGDGKLRKQCQKYGQVHGFCNPEPFLKKAKYCVPGGYLAALEAISFNCVLKLFWNNKIKEDYWKMSPFMKKNVKTWARRQTWQQLANEYLNLYNSIK